MPAEAGKTVRSAVFRLVPLRLICQESSTGVRYAMPQFTSLNSRENAAKSQASHRADALAAKEAGADQRQLSQTESAKSAANPIFDAFVLERLGCVRNQLTRL